MNLVNQLKQRALQHPDRLALIDPKAKITYSQLYAAVSAGAAYLHSNNLQKGDTILILEPISINLYIHLLSVFHAGMTAIIIDPSTSKKTLTNSLNLSPPNAFIASPKAHLLRLTHPNIRKIKKHFHTHGLIPLSRKWKPTQTTAPIIEVTPDHPALITFTSGSTGIPKAACRTHAFLLAQHSALAEALHLKPAQTHLITLPIFAIANLASGITSVIADTDLRFPALADSDTILKQCTTHKVTHCAASPAFFQKLHSDNKLPPFHTIYTGGAPVFPHLIHAIQRAHPQLQIITVYGSTEAEPISHIPWNDVTPTDHINMQTGKGLLVGHPVTSTQLTICPSPHNNHIGEIAVTGDHVLKGYLHGRGDQETKFQLHGKTWHRTGDLGYLDHQNRLWLMGRLTATFTINQKPVYPFSIESAVMHHPQVERCAVINHRNTPLLCIQLTHGKLSDIAADLEHYPHLKPIQLHHIPTDNRHNAKINYPQLKNILNSKRTS